MGPVGLGKGVFYPVIFFLTGLYRIIAYASGSGYSYSLFIDHNQFNIDQIHMRLQVQKDLFT